MRRTRRQKREQVGRWLPVHFELLQTMNVDAAVLLSYLLNHEHYQEEEGRTEDGWFRCSCEMLKRHLNLTTWKERVTITELKDDDFVETSMRGNPAKRWLRLNHAKISEKMNNR